MIFAHLFGWTPDQVEALTWTDWLTFKAFADEMAPTGRAGLLAQHPGLRGRQRG